MKTTLLLLTALLVMFTVPAQAQRYTNRYDTITTTDGTEYKRVSLKRQEGRTVVFFHSSGIGKVDVDLMPDHVLADIGFPTRADRVRAATQKAQFEAQQRAKGLVLYNDQWVTREEQDRLKADAAFNELIKVKEDKFEATTKLILKDSIKIYGDLVYRFECAIQRNDSDLPIFGVVIFENRRLNPKEKKTSRLSDAWPYSDNHRLIFLVDDEPFDLGSTKYDTDIIHAKYHDPTWTPDDLFIELMYTIIPYELFEKIAYGKSVRVRLGRDDHLFGQDAKTAMQAVVAYVKKKYPDIGGHDDNAKTQE